MQQPVPLHGAELQESAAAEVANVVLFSGVALSMELHGACMNKGPPAKVTHVVFLS
jgi:hypothetical protein